MLLDVAQKNFMCCVQDHCQSRHITLGKHAMFIRGVQWFYFSTPGSYFWLHTQSDVNEHTATYQRLRSCGYFKLRILSMQEHWGSFMCVCWKCMEVVDLFCYFVFIQFFFCSFIHGYLLEMGLVTVGLFCGSQQFITEAILFRYFIKSLLKCGGAPLVGSTTLIAFYIC
jgi:hypothetical protein